MSNGDRAYLLINENKSKLIIEIPEPESMIISVSYFATQPLKVRRYLGFLSTTFTTRGFVS